MRCVGIRSYPYNSRTNLALTPGSRLGVYEITAPLGEGGMGQVWRATDTTLGRQVAIKILPDAFAADPDRLARFEREAKTLASLNHPHIAAIHGFEKSSGVQALVMELVEGEDLSQRIARGAIPLDEALPIAKQIAEALEAAHEQGIIHRDLKPANIKVRADGTVKVLDFGLAKATGPPEGDGFSRRQAEAEASALQTITSPAMTQAGMILGTAAYMSPEQARGGVVDKRADLWAYGVVLYEMLTGQRLFEGATISDTLAAVLTREPDWSALPATTPAPVRKLLRRCLEKDRKRRLTDAGAARLEIDDALTAPVLLDGAAASAPRGGQRRLMAALAIAAVAIIALAIPAVRHVRETPTPAPPETRLEIVTPSADEAASFALSPDGRQIVYLGSGEGVSRLWLRSMEVTTAQPLAGTEGARYPFWSPDGRSIGYFANGALKRLDLGGSAPRTVVSYSVGARGATWNADDVILFAPSSASPIMRVSATGGGAAVAITTLLPQQQGHRYPNFLPDGRRFLFYAQGGLDTSGIYLGALDGSAPIRLTPSSGGGIYRPPTFGSTGDDGWLLWVRGDALVAQRLDLEKAALLGEAVTVADDVRGDSLLQNAVSVAATGLIAYRQGAGSARQLTWVDRAGTVLGTIGEPSGNTQSNPRVSPDGRRVVVARTVQGNADLWLLEGNRSIRFTFDPARDDFPEWSPDGTRIVFYSIRTGVGDIYQKLTSGAGAEERLVSSELSLIPNGWSADGRFLMYHSLNPRTLGDLWVLPLMGARTPSVFLQTPFREVWGAFSPDGRWVAYHSDESGRAEVYVRRFALPSGAASADPVRPGSAPATDGQWQVSSAGGVFPQWGRDGKELFYLNPAGTMVAVPITVAGNSIVPGAAAALFPARIVGGGADAQLGPQYDVAPNGRFLINRALDGVPAPITIIQNWNPEGKK